MLQHIMKRAGDASNFQFRVLDYITQNAANMNTTAYKTHSFEQYLRVDGQVDGAPRVDASAGGLIMTHRPLDVGLDGPGYIPVTQPDGTLAYTRDGSFTKNTDGYLITHRGDLVGNGIQLPLYYDKLAIQKDGTVEIYKKGSDFPETVGKIPVVVFNNPEGLESIGFNKVIASEQSGEPIQSNTNGFEQGKLERSNVNMYHQIDQVLRLNAAMITNMRIIKYSDEIYRQAVNLRQ